MNLFEKTLFEKIADRSIPAQIVYEDELAFAIHDIAPQAPLHLLIIPKKPISSLSASSPEDTALLGHLLSLIPTLAAQHGHPANFRVVINTGPLAGQSVFHLHIHLLAGRPFRWPPG